VLGNSQTHGSDRHCRKEAGVVEAPLAQKLFRLFPYGIVVLDGRGGILAANAEAREVLIGQPDEEGVPLTCCGLLGCGADEGPLAGACIATLVMKGEGRLPEMRLDLPAGRGTAWVTAARLGDEGSQFVLQVRHGDPNDRRRRTEPHWRGSAELHIRALGRTRIESREGPIGGAWLEQRPGQVLKLLVCERHRVVPAEAIAAAIWPEAGPSALGNVRHFVHELRDRLEPGRPKRAPSSFVVSRQGGYTLDRSRVRVDADEFERCMRSGLDGFAGGEVAAATEVLGAGLALYEGDLFAEDPYAVWAIPERDRLRDLAGRGLRVLAELEVRSGDLAAAALHVRRLAELEPYDTAIQRRLIELCLRQGRRSEAYRRYSALRMRMLHDFGEELDFEFTDLAREEPLQLTLE
jgi:DNA-binding SARP family transcriptional activator